VSHPTRRLIVAILLTLLVASTASAQRRGSRESSHGNFLFGLQLGFATNSLHFLMGGQFSMPVARQFDFYPSFDIFSPGNSVTVWGINAEGRYWPRLSEENPGLYVGGGLSITNLYVASGLSVTRKKVLGAIASTTDAGLGLLGGWDFKAVSWRPFAQIHIVIGNANRVEFGGGINFRL